MNIAQRFRELIGPERDTPATLADLLDLAGVVDDELAARDNRSVSRPQNRATLRNARKAQEMLDRLRSRPASPLTADHSPLTASTEIVSPYWYPSQWAREESR
jgi:hypothetical protein